MSMVPIACVLLGVAFEPEAQVPPPPALLHLKELFVANRSAFGFGSFRFDHITGQASSAEDARAGRLVHAITGRGFYAYDGTNARYERLYDDQDLLRATRILPETQSGRFRTQSSLNSFRVLTEGRSCLLDSISAAFDLTKVVHSAQILPGVREFYNDLVFPLNLGRSDPNSFDLEYDLNAVEKGEFKVIAYEPGVLLEGRKVVHLALLLPLGRRDYWIDPQCGAVPLQIVVHLDKNGSSQQLNYDDVRQVQGAWLPFKRTHYMDDDHHVIQVLLREAKLDRPPARSVFRLEFPMPIGMVDQARNLTYAAKRRTWDLTNLPSPNSPQVHRLPVVPQYVPPPEMPVERKGWSGLATSFLTAGIVLFFLAILWIYRVHARTRTAET
jgi:hypothetical protein